MNLPIDFEQKVKLPPAINGRSYPYQISARHLMQNFRYAALQVDQSEVGGLQLVETSAPDGTRTVSLAGQAAGGVGGSLHPFKVTYADLQYTVAAGECAGQTISEQTFAEASLSYIFAKIERNTSSRVVIGATLDINTSIPASTEEFQYVAIAYVNGNEIIQLRFEDIRMTEILISDAGELKLVSVFDTTNSYALP
jgi:hypothetical protein